MVLKVAPRAVAGLDATPLRYAAHSGDLQIVERLLASGAEVNVSDKKGHTPTSRAVRMGRDEIAGLLAQHGGK